MKKIFSFLLIAVFGFSLVLVDSAEAAYSPAEGDLIKIANDSGVYKIQNNKRYLFPNAPTFWTHYTGSWSDIKENGKSQSIKIISQFDFGNLESGNNITVKSGSRMVRFQNSSRIYQVFKNNKLKLISEQGARNMYGNSYDVGVVSLQVSFEDNYEKSDEEFVDTDNDGITDDDEINIYNTNPNSSDSDGDGYKDGEEIVFGHDPLVALIFRDENLGIEFQYVLAWASPFESSLAGTGQTFRGPVSWVRELNHQDGVRASHYVLIFEGGIDSYSTLLDDLRNSDIASNIEERNINGNRVISYDEGGIIDNWSAWIVGSEKAVKISAPSNDESVAEFILDTFKFID